MYYDKSDDTSIAGIVDMEGIKNMAGKWENRLR
jgi:hypothetical protein